MSNNIIDSIQLSGTVYTIQGSGGCTVSSAITSGDTNAVAGGAVFDKLAIATTIPSSGVVLTIDEDEYSTNYPTYTNRLVCDFSGASTDYIMTTFEFYDSDKERIDGISVEVEYSDGEFWYLEADGCSATTAGTVLTIEFENNDVAYVKYGDSDKITTVAYGPDTVWLIDRLNSRIDNLNETKQDKLTEGRGITIDTENTISVSLPISAGTGNYSIAEGLGTQASGVRSHAEGYNTIASGNTSHAEGGSTTARGSYSHAEGGSTTARGEYSHAEGGSTTANGHYSHVEGEGTTANGDYSHAEGFYTITNNESEHASGRWNVSSSASTTFGDSGNTLFSVGNGTAYDARHNAFEIRQNGDIYLTKDGVDIKLQDNLGGGGGNPTVELTQAEYDALVSAGTVSANTYYIITDAQSPDISLYWTSAQTQSAITEATSGKVDSSDVYLKTETSGATELSTAFSNKQDTLVSGTNIKTINNESILGSGNITIQGGGGVDSGTVQTMIDSSISGKVNTSSVVSSVTSASTDSEIPTAKAVYDAVGQGGGGGSITIDPTLDSGSTNPVANSAITTAIDAVSGAIPSTYISSIQGDSSGGQIRFVRFSTPSNVNYWLLDNPIINGKRIHKFTGVESEIKQFSLVETSAVTSSMTSSSTDAQVPSAKCVYDQLGGLKLVKLTQSEYDALSPNYDPNTLYIIKD